MDSSLQKAYLIGGGIASLASAAYLIRDGKFSGENIFIFEKSRDVGGSLDGIGTADTEYIIRGIRIFSEDAYNCMLDLLSFIPLNNNSSKTLYDDFKDFNKEVKIFAKARIVENGKVVDSSDLGLSFAQMLTLLKITKLPESSLHNSKISDYFRPSFFETIFWIEFSTTFSFQPWHSMLEFRRYILRSIQELHKMNTLIDGRHTRYNQYDSIIAPLTDWLKGKGVNFIMESRVSSLEFKKVKGVEQVSKIGYLKSNQQENIALGENDLVFFTNGSITANSTSGSNSSAPVLNTNTLDDSSKLWEEIAVGRPHFGNPRAFFSDIEKTKWVSFSVTSKDRTFFDLMENLSHNKPGTGGGTTFKNSNWLLSIIIPHQPHFINQPENINVFWGYGLHQDKVGNFVHKKMSECTGEEILIEVCSHLGFGEHLTKILQYSNCVPCMLPYITSQFMPVNKGDRPDVIPKHTKNFAFIGQYCEIPNEIVFTVEQSVRSAMIAVRGLLHIEKEVPPIYKGPYVKEVTKEFVRSILR